MRHAHRFRRDGSNFLGIHRHGSPPSSASPDALALVLLSVLPILSCFSRLYFCCHSPAESCKGTGGADCRRMSHVPAILSQPGGHAAWPVRGRPLATG